MKRLSILFALILLGTLGTIPVAAQSAVWSLPLPISDIRKTPSSWFPDIAIGPDGSVHIIWSSGLAGAKKEEAGPDLLMYRELRDGKWSPINDIENPGKGGYTVRNSIIMGHDGRLHILVRTGLLTTYYSAPWQQAWAASAWSAPRNINGGSSYFNALATDSKGTLHVFWNEAIPDDPHAPKPACSFCADLFYRRSADDGQTWSNPINLSQSPEGSVKPQVKIAQDNTIHIVWEEGFDWYAAQGAPVAGMYRRSRDGGTTWDPPIRFQLPSVPPPIATAVPGATPAPPAALLPNAPRQITLGLFRNSAPLVVYRGNTTDRLYYHFSEDGGATWRQAGIVPGVRARDIRDTDHDDYSMATDGAGNVHLICAGYLDSDTAPDSPLRLLHLVWNGQSWSAPEVVATDTSYPTLDKITSIDGARLPLYPEWPRAVIDGNTLHITWFTRNRQDLSKSENAHYQVWYAARQLDGASVAPLTLYTPVPTSAPAPPSPTPAPFPTPTVPPEVINARPIDGAQAWEGPGVFALAIAVLAAGALLGLAISARVLVMRRRGRMRG